MKGFARQWIEPQLNFSFILFVVLVHLATVIGVITGVASDSWIAGLATGGGSFAFLVTFLLIVYFGTERYYLKSNNNEKKIIIHLIFRHAWN